MPKLSKLTESDTANTAINALNAAVPNNNGQLVLYPAGSGHGQGWRFLRNGQVVATGSIPQNSHGAKNLKVALNALIDAVATYNIQD
jgi:hypothetical protein